MRIGNFTVHSYGLMIALAILISSILLYREAPREKINPDHVLEAIIVAAFFGLLGSRILYILLNWQYYSGRSILSLLTQYEGLSFYGALFGGVLALYIWSLKRKAGFLKMTDLLAPYLALGYAFGRVGCFLNGCCYGKETSVPWALPIHMGDPVLRHPVPLYAAAGALIIFFILKALRPRRPFVGFILLALFAFYGILRYIVEFFRYGDTVWLSLTAAQLFSLGLVFTILIIFAFYFYNLPGKDKSEQKKPQINDINKIRKERNKSE
ncbi:MAG: prolipoprotein diacylglyceryl transferase [Bacillota bacterium]|nr:prolipoprotein diacylglyceryl transferase [Bacillota bacterium]